MSHSVSRHRAIAIAGFLATALSACGGGGGGGSGPDGPPPTPPVVTLTANPASIVAGATSTLTWNATNATSCTASGAWSGAKATSGSEATAALNADASFTLTCTGTGGTTAAAATVTIVSAPTVTLTASATSVLVNSSVDLTWSSTNATACTAANGWSGTRATSGTEAVGPLSAASSFTLTCTGPGGTDAETVAVAVTLPPAGSVVINGRITFDRIPFDASASQGLNPNAPVESPAREVVVEAVEGITPLVSTTTDSNGRYALVVPTNRNVFIRVRAQMLRAGTPAWNFRILNNTNLDALYVLDGAAADSGIANSTRNLKAASGWNGTSYAATRAAAPFAILDTVYQAKTLILGADADAAFEALDLYWSVDNRASVGFCPDNGDIQTSFYTEGGNDNCTISRPLPPGIYILGDFAGGNGDTDEFDQHVIAHEFGHYFEDKFSRSDSLGGSHLSGDRLDLRLAFGEGWGDAFSAMSLNNPAYRDSQSGVTSGFGFDVEADDSTAEGWFSEFSVMEILWDLFDSAADGSDNIALGFGPIFTVMTTDQVDTDAVTSLFSFIDPLRSRNPASGSAINALLSGESVSITDEFASGETHNGGSDTALPIYTGIIVGPPPVALCVSAEFGADNKLGYSRFLRLDLSAARAVTITATGAVNGANTAAAQDPDIYVYRRGVEVAAGFVAGPSETISQQPLPAGTYIIEVFDFELSAVSVQPRCFTVSITG